MVRMQSVYRCDDCVDISVQVEIDHRHWQQQHTHTHTVLLHCTSHTGSFVKHVLRCSFFRVVLPPPPLLLLRLYRFQFDFHLWCKIFGKMSVWFTEIRLALCHGKMELYAFRLVLHYFLNGNNDTNNNNSKNVVDLYVVSLRVHTLTHVPCVTSFIPMGKTIVNSIQWFYTFLPPLLFVLFLSSYYYYFFLSAVFTVCL